MNLMYLYLILEQFILIDFFNLIKFYWVTISLFIKYKGYFKSTFYKQSLICIILKLFNHHINYSNKNSKEYNFIVIIITTTTKFKINNYILNAIMDLSFN
jgi:hypothetical protein